MRKHVYRKCAGMNYIACDSSLVSSLRQTLNLVAKSGSNLGGDTHIKHSGLTLRETYYSLGMLENNLDI